MAALGARLELWRGISRNPSGRGRNSFIRWHSGATLGTGFPLKPAIHAKTFSGHFVAQAVEENRISHLIRRISPAREIGPPQLQFGFISEGCVFLRNGSKLTQAIGPEQQLPFPLPFDETMTVERIGLEQLGDARGTVHAHCRIIKRAPAREAFIGFNHASLRVSIPIADRGEIDITDARHAFASRPSLAVDRWREATTFVSSARRLHGSGTGKWRGKYQR